MRIRSAIMTLLNVTAMADGKMAEAEKKMIYDVLKKQFFCSDEELEQGFKENLESIEKDTPAMIKEAVLVMREKCSADELKNVIKLIKDLSVADRKLDRREMMIVEMLEHLVALQ